MINPDHCPRAIVLFCVVILCFQSLCAADSACKLVPCSLPVHLDAQRTSCLVFLNINNPFPKKSSLVGSSTPELPAQASVSHGSIHGLQLRIPWLTMENPYPWNKLFSSILANSIFISSLILWLMSVLDCPLPKVQTCSINSITPSPQYPRNK